MAYNIEKAFDTLWLEDCMIDIFDNIKEENRNEKISLLYLMNKKNNVGIKTKHGMTERICIPDIVQQGGKWGPVKCSSSVDTLGKKVIERKEVFYRYCNTVNIIPLTYIDDCFGIAECGFNTLKLNVFLTSQIESKNLKFNEGTEKKRKMS